MTQHVSRVKKRKVKPIRVSCGLRGQTSRSSLMLLLEATRRAEKTGSLPRLFIHAQVVQKKNNKKFAIHADYFARARNGVKENGGAVGGLDQLCRKRRTTLCGPRKYTKEPELRRSLGRRVRAPQPSTGGAGLGPANRDARNECMEKRSQSHGEDNPRGGDS